jgi:hypothetical protein
MGEEGGHGHSTHSQGVVDTHAKTGRTYRPRRRKTNLSLHSWPTMMKTSTDDGGDSGHDNDNKNNNDDDDEFFGPQDSDLDDDDNDFVGEVAGRTRAKDHQSQQPRPQLPPVSSSSSSSRAPFGMMSHSELKAQQQRLYNIAYMDAFDQSKDEESKLQLGFENGYCKTFEIGKRIGTLLGHVTTQQQLMTMKSKGKSNSKKNLATTTTKVSQKLKPQQSTSSSMNQVTTTSTETKTKNKSDGYAVEGTATTEKTAIIYTLQANQEKIREASKLIRDFFDTGFSSTPSSSSSQSMRTSSTSPPLLSSSTIEPKQKKDPAMSTKQCNDDNDGDNDDSSSSMKEVLSNLQVLEEQIQTLLLRHAPEETSS